MSQLYRELESAIDEMRGDLVEIACQLVRNPSINHPPDGDELACQQIIANVFKSADLQPELYQPDLVPGIQAHTAFFPGRSYINRPNVVARRRGTGGGRSLLLSGHIDTVPLGLQDWTVDPFSGLIKDGKLYGLGAYDMKGGMAAILGVALALQRCQVQLKGDVIFESVVDEEFAGVNGTLAGRLHGDQPDAAIIPEPSDGAINNGVSGGRVAHVTLKGRSGILIRDEEPGLAVRQLSTFLKWVNIWRERRRAKQQSMQLGPADYAPLWVTKVQAGGWGFNYPITVPGVVQIELYWQLMPGEEQEQVDKEFFDWLEELAAADPVNFPAAPIAMFPVRFMPASQIPSDDPLIRLLSRCVQQVRSQEPPVYPLPAPSDLYLIQRDFHTKAVHYGPGGANAHAADEYVCIDDIIDCTKVFSLFILEWCGHT